MQARLRKLLQKYNVPGPRYTSYPTVPAWRETVGPEDYRASLAQLTKNELSLYFHLPFCERLCHFCACMKVITKNHAASRDYVDLVLQEVTQVVNCLPPGRPTVNQVHFGGGTPNFLQAEELTDLVQAIRAHCVLTSDAEIAIEMHPKTSTREFCDNLKKLGFNRISLGVQDFDPKVQELIHRFQTYEQTVEMVGYLRALGFNSFNFDLVYGLPGQTMAAWEDTLQKVIRLRPNRLAVYSYANVPWKHPVQRSFRESDLPTPELKIELFGKAYEVFLQNGYCLIGMDHFALAGDELTQALEQGTIHRNFMGYSTRKDSHQIGFGVSAISYVSGNYFQNLKELKPYTETIAGGRLATSRGFLLTEDDHLRRAVITRLMCAGRIDFSDSFSQELEALQPFIDDGLLAETPAGLQVVDFGFLFLRNMAMVFDRYLEEICYEAKTPTFSQTI